jgi:hypothetical protein
MGINYVATAKHVAFVALSAYGASEGYGRPGVNVGNAHN